MARNRRRLGTMDLEVTTLEIGGRSPEQVDGRIAAGSLDLDPCGLEQIAGAIRRTPAGSGPVVGSWKGAA